MPVEVKSTISGDEVLGTLSRRIALELPVLAEASANRMLELILFELETLWPQVQITPGAEQRYPWLANWSDLYGVYIQTLNVVEVAETQTWRVQVDRQALELQGYPADLPELLEFGTGDGVPHVPHWIPARLKFETNEIGILKDEFVRRIRK